MKRFFLAAIVAVAMVSGVQAQNVKVGDKLADFTLTSVNGEPVSLSQFKGQVVLELQPMLSHLFALQSALTSSPAGHATMMLQLRMQGR